MADERMVDEHLGVVLNEVLDAVYQAKQVSWAASTSPAHAELRDLVSFLIDQSGRIMEAEARIDGRAAGIASPSSHQRGNLVAEGHGDLPTAIATLVQRLDALAADVRTRAETIPDAKEAPMLMALADGIRSRTARLRAG